MLGVWKKTWKIIVISNFLQNRLERCLTQVLDNVIIIHVNASKFFWNRNH